MPLVLSMSPKKACDYVRNSETGRLKPKDGHHHRVYNTCLQQYIHAGIGAEKH